MLTGHGLTNDFNVLDMCFDILDMCFDVKYLPESHTGQCIADEILKSVDRWAPSLKYKQIYVVSDNASNCRSAGSLLPHNYTALYCFADTLQLAINDSISEFRAAQTVIAKCQKIYRHFRRSTKFTKMLKNMQEKLGVLQLKL